MNRHAHIFESTGRSNDRESGIVRKMPLAFLLVAWLLVGAPATAQELIPVLSGDFSVDTSTPIARFAVDVDGPRVGIVAADRTKWVGLSREGPAAPDVMFGEGFPAEGGAFFGVDLLFVTPPTGKGAGPDVIAVMNEEEGVTGNLSTVINSFVGSESSVYELPPRPFNGFDGEPDIWLTEVNASEAAVHYYDRVEAPFAITPIPTDGSTPGPTQSFGESLGLVGFVVTDVDYFSESNEEKGPSEREKIYHLAIDIYAELFGSEERRGSVKGTNVTRVRVSSLPSEAEGPAELSINQQTGNLIVVWNHLETLFSQPVLYCRPFDSDLNPLADPVEIRADARNADVVHDEQGHAHIVYEVLDAGAGKGPGSGLDLYGQTVDAACQPVGDEFLITDAPRHQTNPQVVAFEDALPAPQLMVVYNNEVETEYGFDVPLSFVCLAPVNPDVIFTSTFNPVVDERNLCAAPSVAAKREGGRTREGS